MYKVDSSEFEKKKFESFNDFFTRRLKKESRPISQDPSKLALPADGRYLAYPKIEHIYAKGQQFSVEGLLGDPLLAKRYVDGSMVIVRLCPVDYHRFHFPCDGMPSAARLIAGPLFSVNPLALRKRLSILWENKRMVTELDTERFGKIAYVEIGATNVGSIRQTYIPNRSILKGDEKGYFEFGGSCLILLFEPGKVLLSGDLVENTRKGFETLGKVGEVL